MLENGWFWLRATGLVLLVLLAATLALGASTKRARAGSNGPARVPSYVVQTLHRHLSVLVVVFTLGHVWWAVRDEYVPIDWVDVVVPSTASWNPAGLIPGVLAFDVLVVVLITSTLRSRLHPRLWSALHTLAYPCVGLGFAHGILAGTDRGQGFAWLCFGVALALAGLATWSSRPAQREGLR